MILTSSFGPIELVAALTAGMIVLLCRKRLLRRDVRLPVAGILLLVLLKSLSTGLKWSGTTGVLEVVGDYGTLLLPVLLGVLIYVFLKKEKADRESRHSEERFRSLVETTRDWVWEVDGNRIFTYSSPRVKELLGYEPEEIVGQMTPFDLMPPTEAERMRALCLNPDLEHEALSGVEHTNRHKDGHLVVLETNRVPIFDEHGNIVGYRGADRGITARKKAEEALRISEEKYRAITHTAHDAIVMIDGNGNISFWNPAAEHIFGYSPEEALGMDLHGLLSPQRQHQACRQGMELFKEKGQGAAVGKTLELTAIRKNGSEFPVEVSLSAIRKDDAWHAIGVIRDITKRRQAEDELRKYRKRLEDMVQRQTADLVVANKKLQEEIEERKCAEKELLKAQQLDSLSVLAGGVAHDFNNLLTAIIGNLSLAKLYTKPGAAITERLDEIQKASVRAKDLTHQLLSFSKGGSPVRTIASLSMLITDSTKFILRGSNVDCEFHFPDDLWSIEADAGQISQVNQNLVINAHQAMPDGGIITVRAENVVAGEQEIPSLKAGRYVRLSVEDRGVGIPEAHLARIFDPYFTTKERGSGLGLAISATIVKNQNGLIVVDSKPDAGTVFHVYLPASEKKLSAADVAEQGAEVKKGKVLVMDDEEIIKDVALVMLHSLGCEADAVSDGSEAVKQYLFQKTNKKPYDAVIMDLTIPGGMGGKTAVQKLREVDPGVKVIASSGYLDDPVMADFRQYGFSGVLPKPYAVDEMSKALQSVLGSG